VDILYALQQLNGEHANRFDGEFPVAEIEKLFQIGSEKFEDQAMVFVHVGRSEVVDVGKALVRRKPLVEFVLDLE